MLTARLLIHSLLVHFARSTVKCFCDKRNCEDSLICTGERCLIGFRSDGEQAQLDQLCTTREANNLQKCEQNWNGWQEVCACDDDFCNTFAFLRGSIEQQNTLNDDTRVPILHEEPSGPSARRYHGNNLIILLVIIPLSVGALAVCLIFVNYHCKMC
uniref:Activin types I and II receptor domain-containing protein n=1 Tax=Parascaris univalens TaxID=6257 RepID=A0A914ZPB0_PARUN